MTSDLNLIGLMATRTIRTVIDSGPSDAGFARFLVHALARDEILAIVDAIARDAELSSRIEVCLPRYKYEDEKDIPQTFLTDASATELRHIDCEREGRVIVLGDESQMQSLAQVEKIDADVLMDIRRSRAWVEAACGDHPIKEDVLVQWDSALRALLRIDRTSLRQISAYLTNVAAELRSGCDLAPALGRCLNSIRLPRYEKLFTDITETKLHHMSQWQQRYEAHWKRECYIAKRDRSQIPFSRATLAAKLEELPADMPNEVRTALKAYVDAPDGTSEDSFALFSHDWSHFPSFFEDVQKADGRPLGIETRMFYDLRSPSLLTDQYREYIAKFAEERRKNPTKNPEDERFYALHSHQIAEDPRLAARWERFILGQSIECVDFLDGLVQCMRRLYQAGEHDQRVLIVKGMESTPLQFLQLNDDVCRAFATRYRGLDALLKNLVEFKDAKAFDYIEIRKGQAFKDRRKRGDQPMSARARRLAFRVWIEKRADGRTIERSVELRLVWECDTKEVGLCLVDDLKRLRENLTGTPLVRCVAARSEAGGKVQPAALDLRDVACLEPAASRDRGSFVPAASRCKSLASAWRSELRALVSDGLVVDDVRTDLEASFARFEESYADAIGKLLENGFAEPLLEEQAVLYGKLLGMIVDAVDRPVALERLLRPLLDIGSAQIDGSAAATPAAIVMPWHPLRLAACASRWQMFRLRLGRLLAPGRTTFTDGGALFFTEFRRALAEPASPEIAVGWEGAKPNVLAFANGINGYSLHERPVKSHGTPGSTSDTVRVVANQISDLVQDYIRLQPHEKDNLCVVLYNCDAADLPQAVVDRVRLEADKAGRDAMCQVILRHREQEQLGSIYRQLVAREVDADGLHASEASRDFMARLRISIMVDHGVPALTPDGPPLDIVFCHNVISRAATEAWQEVTHIVGHGIEIDPGLWSRRHPIRKGDRDAIVYLVCPAQTAEGWSYIDAMAALHMPDQARRARAAKTSLVPARRTDVKDPGTQQILEETHRLGSWVVNFDDLLDRRQLAERDIRIIRYKHAATGGRGLVISSQAPDGLLRATLRNRIRSLDPLGYTEPELEALSNRLIDDANAVSGDIVLRAAKRGTNASELIGVVLSKFLVEAELGPDTPRAWIFLDDYAAWLGQAEKRIADLLCLAPRIDPDGSAVLGIVVTEAKYIKASGAKSKAADSARQLRDTLVRLEKVLNAESPPADRDIWLARLSEMLMDGMREPQGLDAGGVNWRTTLRHGRCRIELRGYSHVFAHAPPDEISSFADEGIGDKETKSGSQERYSPATLRRILRCYANRQDPTPIRAAATGGSSRLTSIEASAAADAPPVVPTTAVPIPTARNQAADPTGRAAADEASDGSPDPLVSSADEASDPPLHLPAGDPADEAFEAETCFDRTLAAITRDVSADRSDFDWLEDVAVRCRQAFLSYGMSAKLEHKILTPNAALLKFKGTDNLTTASVERRERELESTHSLKILGVRSEPGLVGVSVKRPRREVLTLASVWRKWRRSPGEANSRLLIAVKEDDGEPLFLSPDPAPHSLIAGSTGSGKSVLLQSLLLGIAATNTPEQAKIILIDPKSGVDYFPFEPLPHLDGGIIDDSKTALAKLEWLVTEMERRYAQFKTSRTFDLEAYNKQAAEPLPTIWLVHDEFADWMQIDSYRNGVEVAVNRLGVKARAAGIYLIFAAQRPDNTVFPMQLRSNLGNRLVLRVDSPGTSDLSLGIKGGGAERLLGKGHLAAVLGGGNDPIYAQVPYVSGGDLVKMVEAICRDLGSA